VASVQPISDAAEARPAIPERYALRKKDGARFLECDEAPRIRAIIDPGMSISRSAAASLGERVILLDGAGSFGPLIDNDAKLYNLDHHAGCERLFTLSTCEQALLLVQGGLNLSEGDWRIYANEPDLDTVLALWCLLNFRRLRELNSEARDVLLPLLRLEGAIDANGPKLAAFCGLSNRAMQFSMRRIEHLLARERELKQSGSWREKKLLPYTMEMLCAVDSLVYKGEDFGDHSRIDEIYGHVEVEERRVAVICRDTAGIYTVEQHLKTRWGDQLSLIALENAPGQYTLRRVSSLAGPKLGAAYDRLNRLDRAVDGQPVGKRWGGSEDIGGSPRPNGTLLAPDDLLREIERAYRPSTWWSRSRQTVGAFFVGVACMLFWSLANFFPSPSPVGSLRASLAASYELGLTSLLILAVGMVFTRFLGHRRPWVFGWRLPVNGGGWLLLPIALLGALPVAVWGGIWTQPRALDLAAAMSASVLAITAGEVWFRGLVHGMLVPNYPVQRPLGVWLISRAAFTSAAAYASVAAVLMVTVVDSTLLRRSGLGEGEFVLGVATLFFGVGLALAALRERSLSFVPGLAIQLLGLTMAGGIAALLL
jgi:hypothetical protein